MGKGLGVVVARGRSFGLGSVRGVRGLPSSYASSRGHPPRGARVGWDSVVGLCAQSGNPRSSVLDGPKRQAPTTLNSRRTVRSASCRASIRSFTVGKVFRLAGGKAGVGLGWVRLGK